MLLHISASQRLRRSRLGDEAALFDRYGARRFAIPALAVALAATACTPALELTPSDAGVVLSSQALDAPDPGQPGDYDVLTLYYGSGTDKNRPE